jgi:hypothetical protein
MVRKRRIHYTETDKAVMWDRWQKGESLEKIAQLFDRGHGSVARIFLQTGGIRPPKKVRQRGRFLRSQDPKATLRRRAQVRCGQYFRWKARQPRDAGGTGSHRIRRWCMVCGTLASAESRPEAIDSCE